MRPFDGFGSHERFPVRGNPVIRHETLVVQDSVFLMALASVMHIGDLQALSVSATCMEFGPNDSKVILKPRHGYVPKSLNTPFRVQVISLSALLVYNKEKDASFFCPVRAIRAYVSHPSVFRQTEQLFVSFSRHSRD